MLKRIIPVLVVAVALALSPLHAENAQGSTCALSGGGTEASPWLVEDDSDFRLIGDGGCLLSGHYKQTADITLRSAVSDPPSTTTVATAFSGVYDGDFYTIALGETVDGQGNTVAGSWTLHNTVGGVFGEYLSGTIRKLYLTGNYTTTSYEGQPLVRFVSQGGYISQVHSSVNVTVKSSTPTVKVGGLVQKLGRGAVLEYSSATGDLRWDPAPPAPNIPSIFGGLVVEAGRDLNSLDENHPRSTEIRDSYSKVTVEWPSGGKCRAMFGGIVGQTETIGGDLYLVRVYSASSIESQISGVSECGAVPATVGGLVGRSDTLRTLVLNGTDESFTYLVSSFWATDLIGGVTQSIGFPILPPSDPPNPRTLFYVDGVPRGVGVTSSTLRNITTFQSREGTTAGAPSGLADLPIASSTGSKPLDGTLSTNAGTYRWGIEPGDQRVFVPVTYTDSQDFLTRTLFTDSEREVERSMAGRGSTLDGDPVTNYPHLGRIWEICSNENDGFPTLVWELKECGGVQGAAYTGDPNADPSLGQGGGTSDGESSSRSRAGSSSSATAASQTEGALLAATGPGALQSLFFLSTSAILMLLGVAGLWVRGQRRKDSSFSLRP